MKLSCAMAVAAGGMDLQDKHLRAVAQTLESEQRGPGKRPRTAISSTSLDRDARWRQESVLALQTSRRLLARTIDMLT